MKKRCNFQLRFLLDRAGVGAFQLVMLLVILCRARVGAMVSASEKRRGGDVENLARSVWLVRFCLSQRTTFSSKNEGLHEICVKMW